MGPRPGPLLEGAGVLDAGRSEPDEDVYDALHDVHGEALCALLALPAPDLAGLAAKLDVFVAHLAWEQTGAEDCLEIFPQDATVSLRRQPEFVSREGTRRPRRGMPPIAAGDFPISLEPLRAFACFAFLRVNQFFAPPRRIDH